MSDDDNRPAFACRCLNIRLYRRKENQKSSQPQSGAPAEYQPLYVGDNGIKIAHNELTLRTRYAVSIDSSSATGLTQQTLVTCLVCDTAAYRVKAEVPPDADAKEGPVIPTEDWVERDTLMSKCGCVDVHVGKGGCIIEDEIRRVTSSPSYSQYFSLALPFESHVLSTAQPSILPQTRLAVPASHSFLTSLPPFLPPPPFTPSHPIFLHLSSIATASSNDARSNAEKRIEEFAKHQLAQLEEHETTLKTQLEHLWRIVKEGLKKAERERDADLFPTRRRSMSPRRGPPALGGVGSSVVRSFVPSTYHAPRASNSSAARHSALSASLATTSFHHPNARQEAITGQPDSTVPAQRPPPLTPSPPPYTSNPSSSGSSSGSGSSSIANMSRSLKRNMDASNDIAVTYRWYAIEEQEASRRKAREKMKREKENNKTNGVEKEVRESKKTASGSDGVQRTPPPSATNLKGEKKSSTANSKEDGARKKDGRRKVTFDVEPNVVTIKRDITAEADQERVPENGEDLLFDMDGVEPGTAERKDKSPVEDVQSESQAVITFHEAPERIQRPSRRQIDLKDAGLPQSFVALRPSSLPAPSNVRPPIRSRSDEKRTKPVPASASSSSNAKPSEAKDIDRPSTKEGSSEEVLSPQQKDLLKLVAADTPSHRGLWKQGSDAWKIFDRNVGYSSTTGRSSTIIEEDEENEPLKAPNTNGAKAENSDWRHYRRPDVVGSVPIPMAPISQQKLGGTPSLQPKTSLADRQGVLVPPLPVVVEESEGRRERSAASSRKEVYAERNKVRGLDPGFLDFADEDEEEDPGRLEQDDDVDQVSTSRSRQHALKIIKARNAVPAEGLWRSLV